MWCLPFTLCNKLLYSFIWKSDRFSIFCFIFKLSPQILDKVDSLKKVGNFFPKSIPVRKNKYTETERHDTTCCVRHNNSLVVLGYKVTGGEATGVYKEQTASVSRKQRTDCK